LRRASRPVESTEPPDQHRQALLDSSASYVEAKVAFADAIVSVQRAGMDVDVIARVTGLSVTSIRAVLRTA
jgi:hypothetical protein